MATDPAHHENHNSRKLNYALGGLVVGLFVILLLACYSHSRQEKSITGAFMSGRSFTGSYRGLGWHNEPGFFGKNWYQVRMDVQDYGGYWAEAQFSGYGYTPFRSYYPDGAIRSEGRCLVKQDEFGQPYLDETDILDGKYYDLEGKLLSQVKYGKGVRTLTDATGRVRSETLQRRDGSTVTSWFNRSEVRIKQWTYGSDRKASGPFLENYPSGKPHLRGRYGPDVFLRFALAEDGSLQFIERNKPNDHNREDYKPGERFPTEEERVEIQAIEAELGYRTKADPANTPVGD